MSTAEEFKSLGNRAFSAGEYDAAIKHFSDSIALDPANAVLYSNRSAAHASLKDYHEALRDAEKTVELKPEWGKGYGRLGAAHMGLSDYDAARDAYKKGLELDTENAVLKKGYNEAVAAGERQTGDISGGLGALFQGDVWSKIAANSKTSAFMADKAYVSKMQAIISNPTLLNMHLQDEKITATVMVLLGLDMNAPDGGSPAYDAGAQKEESAPKSKPEAPSPAPVAEDEPMEEESEEAAKKKQAVEAKERGNAFYKKKVFERAIEEYRAAQELDPTNMAYLTNQAAVYFEQGKFEDCIKTCEEAIDLGREHRADFKLIAKAFARIANSYLKLDNFDNAVKFYNKSLAEHRTSDVLSKLQDVQRLKKQHEKAAYHNVELSDKARDEGNSAFKAGDWAKAVQHYTEAIKRNESDPRAYSNRAACYTKLMAFPEALKDCDEAIKLDPTFVKAYIRKAAIEFLKKEYTKCMAICEQALAQDKAGKHRAEIEQQMYKCQVATMSGMDDMTDEQRAKHAMNDPEIQAILSDPVMASILEQMQQDPKAVREHIQNPAIAAKLQKLVNAGIVRTSRA